MISILNFAPNVDSIMVEIPIVNDVIFELDEVFNAILENPGERVVIGAADTADITILDNDGKCIDDKHRTNHTTSHFYALTYATRSIG